MGAGKTTFARALLGALGIEQPPEGSPSFAIAHEYWCRRGDVVHMDLYRIKSEGEIEEAGLETYFWERELIAITEWLASWPGFERAVRRSGVCWRVEIAFRPGEEVRRDVRIFRSGPEGSG